MFLVLGMNKTGKVSTITQLVPQSSRQMMGYVLKTNHGKIIVIDGGTKEDSNALLQQIRENGGKIDSWFLTHAHDDHVGAFVQLMQTEEIEVNHIYVSTNELDWYQEHEPARAEFTKTFLEILEADNLKGKVIEPKVNQKMKIDNIQVEILGIKNPELTENAGNEQSMVMKFKMGKRSFLVLGDTGVKSSEKLLQTQKEKLKSDIVQMAHHGQAGATKDLYQAIHPSICLWPTPNWLWENDAGKGNNTGPWKTIETRQWMEELGVKEHYVAKDGAVTI